METQRAVKLKFNGEGVAQLTGLQGKELGMLMKHFKESFDTPEALQQFVLNQPRALLEQRIVSVRRQLSL